MKKLYFKNFITFFIIFLLLISLSITAYAHAGKTDEYGGHFDGETGEYHYHHGYPAHQHENGICPYDYDDNADHSSGSHSSGSTNGEYTTVEHQSTTSHYRHPNSQSDSNYSNNSVEKERKSNQSDTGLIVTFSIVAFFALSYILFIVIRKIIRKKECKKYFNILKPRLEQITNNEKNIKFQLEQRLSCNLNEAKSEENKIKILISQQLSCSLNQIKQKKKEVDNLYEKIKLKNPKVYYEYHYGNKTIESIAEFPEGIHLKEGNLKDSQSHEPFGRFTGYIANTGKVVHAKYGCSGAYEPIHLIENRQKITKRPPCQKCMMHSLKYKYYNEIPEWYLKYINIKRIKYLYNIK